MGGTPKRMERFAFYMMEQLNHKLPAGTTLLRYSTDLVMWQNVPANLYQILGGDPVRNLVIYRVVIPATFAPTLFMRLERLP